MSNFMIIFRAGPDRQILSGHSKGVLSVSWCRQDADLLLSCGKDNRTLCWNPQTGEIIGELPATNDWAFQTTWCARNPDLLATASFDGHIGIHSLQTTHIPEQAGPSISETATADDVFGALGSQEPAEDNSNVLSLKQPPKWLRRPVSATFGYGGLLATTSNLPGASGKHQSGVVHLRNIVTEQSIIDRAQALDQAGGDKEKLAELCTKKVDEDAAWKTLSTLFKADSRDELIKMLGFSKDDVARQVQEAIKQFPADRIPTVTFAEPEAEQENGEEEVETPKESEMRGTPSEVSLTSDTTKRTEATEVTEQSLFDDEAPAAGGGADFFSSMASGTTPLRNPLIDGIVPHKQGAASSVAATVGSRASSVRSETIKDNNFRIYPSGESDVDRLVTQALVLGDFKSAVDLCLASERFADALLLAVRGGPELLASTQKAYFNRRTTSLPFLRVFQSIVTEDLADIVQNADLAEWKVVFVVLCTFAKDSDFNNLAEQLGQRLQFRSRVFSNSDSPEAQVSAKEARGDATLCYLAARRLEKVVGIWIDEMREEEESSQSTRYSAHAHALQSFIEKVAVFQAATGYTDQDLAHPTESAEAAETGARSYKLAGLYDRFYEYADLLATQGQVDMAAKYVQMTPSDYKGTGAGGSELDKARDRLFRAAGISEGSVQAGLNAAFAKVSIASSSSSKAPAQTYGGYQPQPQAQAQPTAYAPQSAQPTGYASAPVSATPASTTNNPYAPPPSTYGGYSDQSAYAPQQSQPQQGYQPSYGSNGYPGDPQPQGYGGGYAPNQQPQQQAYGMQPQQQQSYGAPPTQTLAPPPRAINSNSTSTPPPVPAAQRRDMPGWNDAPSFAPPPKRPQSAAKEHKPAPIMSPFPNSTPDPMAQAGMAIQGQGPPRATPPPPRNQPGVLPPPPKGAPRPPSAQAVARQTLGGPPPQQGGPPPPQQGGPPPQSRPTPPPARAGPPPGTFAGPPPLGNMAGGPPPRALSPLGPGRAAQQPPSISSGFRPTPPPSQAQGGPKPGLSPPQGSQARMGGPPPPGRPAGGPPPPTKSASPAPAPRPTSVPPKASHRTSLPSFLVMG
jgi:protein transport protein SEC31